jgi:hypothetical protein
VEQVERGGGARGAEEEVAGVGGVAAPGGEAVPEGGEPCLRRGGGGGGGAGLREGAQQRALGVDDDEEIERVGGEEQRLVIPLVPLAHSGDPAVVGLALAWRVEVEVVAAGFGGVGDGFGWRQGLAVLGGQALPGAGDGGGRESAGKEIMD